MKQQLLFILIFIPFVAFSQNADSTKTRRISIGLTYSPDYSYRILKPNTSSEWIATLRDSLEIPKYGFTTGLNIAFKINKRISLEAGILYADKGYKTIKLTGTTVVPEPSLPTTISNNYQYIYLDIPLKINYYLLTHRTKLYVTAGLSPNIYIKQKTKSTGEHADGHTSISSFSTNDGNSKINLATMVGFGASYDLTKSLYFKVEPIYRRSITPFESTSLKQHLYSAGANVGVYFKI
jgi:hypothetical protein